MIKLSKKEKAIIHSNIKKSLESLIESFNLRSGAKFKLVEDINDDRAKYDVKIVDSNDVTVSSATVYGGRGGDGINKAYDNLYSGPHIKFLYQDKIPTGYASK